MPSAGWYYRLSEFFKNKFGDRVYKVPVHAGFTCPNRDGTISDSGCIFCYNPGFSPPAHKSMSAGDIISVKEQIIQYQIRLECKNSYSASGKHKETKEKYTAKNIILPGDFIPGRNYIAYFQSYSNTYGPLSKLSGLYEEALSVPGIIGLSIATRPDCLNCEILDLLEEYAKHFHVWLELGLQSAHDNTLKLINRGHTFKQFADAVINSAERGIFVCAHLINGLPGETPDNMRQTAESINKLPLQGVKFHQLQVVKHTVLEKIYLEEKIKLMDVADYLNIVCDQLEILRNDIVIHRLLGEVFDSELLLAPRWEIFRGTFSQMIEKELKKRNSYQGIIS